MCYLLCFRGVMIGGDGPLWRSVHGLWLQSEGWKDSAETELECVAHLELRSSLQCPTTEVGKVNIYSRAERCMG